LELIDLISGINRPGEMASGRNERKDHQKTAYGFLPGGKSGDLGEKSD
jgi:hypothetical protein